MPGEALLAMRQQPSRQAMRQERKKKKEEKIEEQLDPRYVSGVQHGE